MTVRLTDNGVKFSSSNRILGKYSATGTPAFLLGAMWGVVAEDGTKVMFIRPVAELSDAERQELSEYMIGVWRRFGEQD